MQGVPRARQRPRAIATAPGATLRGDAHPLPSAPGATLPRRAHPLPSSRPVPMGQFQKHVFVCTSGKTCTAQDSATTFAILKDAVKAAGLAQQVRVNHSGCLGQCGHGPMVVVHPEDTWYDGVTAERARRIAAEHLIGGTPVEGFRYLAPPGENKLPKDQRPGEST